LKTEIKEAKPTCSNILKDHITKMIIAAFRLDNFVKIDKPILISKIHHKENILMLSKKAFKGRLIFLFLKNRSNPRNTRRSSGLLME
jgi:hypothetical protein